MRLPSSLPVTSKRPYFLIQSHWGRRLRFQHTQFWGWARHSVQNTQPCYRYGSGRGYGATNIALESGPRSSNPKAALPFLVSSSGLVVLNIIDKLKWSKQTSPSQTSLNFPLTYLTTFLVFLVECLLIVSNLMYVKLSF